MLVVDDEDLEASLPQPAGDGLHQPGSGRRAKRSSSSRPCSLIDVGPGRWWGRVIQQLTVVFGLLGKRWSGIIVGTLMQRPARFRELANAIPGISDSVLNERLRELMAAGLIDRELAEGPATAVRYRLTPAGDDLRSALSELKAWADRQGYVPVDPVAGTSP